MKVTPIYIRSLLLTGVKTFSGPAELLMGKPNGEISKWTLILGENGIGKSTLLQCIAWMKPALPYDMADTDDLKPSPLINDEENETLERLVSRFSNKQLKAEIHGNFVANQKLGTVPNEAPDTCETSMVIGLDKDRKLLLVEPFVSDEKKEVFYKDEVIVYGYSASRVLGKQNLANSKLLDTIPGFISERSELYDTEEILHTLNYARLGSTNEKEREKYSKFIDDVKKMLVDVLPDYEDIASIDILPPKVLLNDPEGGVVITTKFGKKIPFGDFSLGYKTVTSWTIDLAWRLFNKYQAVSNEPLKEPAIVLIDEIDLHLHPIWQRDIMQNLSANFPNVQFIATAHSPLMVQAALDFNYAVVSYNEDEKNLQIINRPENLDGWRVDQILTSELFGLETARGIKYDEIILRRRELTSKKKLTDEEKTELADIDENLKKLPTGEDPEEIKKREFISNLYDKIQSGEIKFAE
ncbi:AAA family ATPase [Mucilaginibacter kameinonensis]|uniref:AAA family ATPase n=1 Tax=Mucilaginibacter kameinonensis TaxID=452286 RepID=UPI000EF7B2F6|nr:AAA family ATPase [Mucilaginibacter kameinonensis]